MCVGTTCSCRRTLEFITRPRLINSLGQDKCEVSPNQRKDLVNTEIQDLWYKCQKIILLLHFLTIIPLYKGQLRPFELCQVNVNMSGYEYLSSEGYRLDGRRPHEIRKVSCALGIVKDADGSAYLEQGNTKVLAKVWGPREPTKLSRAREAGVEERCYVSCQYSMSHYSTSERRERTSGDRRTQDISQHLQQLFNTVILTELYPRSQIDIFVEVVQADGSLECCAVNACSLALVCAGIPCRDYVSACSATYLQHDPSDSGAGTEAGVALLDVNHQEESAADGALITVATLPKTGRIVQLDITSPLHQDHLRTLLTALTAGCRDLHAVCQHAVTDYVTQHQQ